MLFNHLSKKEKPAAKISCHEPPKELIEKYKKKTPAAKISCSRLSEAEIAELRKQQEKSRKESIKTCKR